ncbi:hypothetical protein S58_33470 [Bradyrhizobium oligotrophicum S58]|uniref:Uncharacterized protein n=1 Tax=Bradyrhizobium oligotrophicum S58 TaxID=1245469 RepID=M4Z701_9BRAD|nr:hypothetical protein S58_33470 [Bradyrhizobium oligotrophicum S58]
MKHTFDISKHIVVPEAKNAIAGSLDLPGAGSVLLLLPIMLAAVDFDHELRFAADEIDDEGSDLRLPAEVRTGELDVVAEALPKDPFSFGRFGAHSLRE